MSKSSARWRWRVMFWGSRWERGYFYLLMVGECCLGELLVQLCSLLLLGLEFLFNELAIDLHFALTLHILCGTLACFRNLSSSLCNCYSYPSRSSYILLTRFLTKHSVSTNKSYNELNSLSLSPIALSFSVLLINQSTLLFMEEGGVVGGRLGVEWE